MENRLANIIVNYSINVVENEKVLITTKNSSIPLVKELIKEINKKKGIPFVKIIDEEVNSFIMETCDFNRVELIKKTKEFETFNFDSFIMIDFSKNDFLSLNVNKEVLDKINYETSYFENIRINQKKWVILNYPTLLDAHKAKMTYDDYYKFAFDVMTYDYQNLYNDMIPLKNLMDKTDKVRIISEKTDLTFSIKDINSVICAGKNNIPDGEIFTAPIVNSVNGHILFNTPSPYRGNVFNNIYLEFVNGLIVNATSDNTLLLNEILDTDVGARYIGEFAIGLNKLITKPMGDILFDEKINGSIHLTPGRCYEEANNGNLSSIHWDLVLIQTDEYNGGEIYFDDLLVRKNGLFILDELKHLN